MPFYLFWTIDILVDFLVLGGATWDLNVCPKEHPNAALTKYFLLILKHYIPVAFPVLGGATLDLNVCPK